VQLSLPVGNASTASCAPWATKEEEEEEEETQKKKSSA
jgi:hypothetical protein